MMKICDSIGISYDYHVSSEAMPVPVEVVKEMLDKDLYE